MPISIPKKSKPSEAAVQEEVKAAAEAKAVEAKQEQPDLHEEHKEAEQKAADKTGNPHTDDHIAEKTALEQLSTTQGKATTKVTNKKTGTEKVIEENVGPAYMSNKPPAIVGLSLGNTLNLGNYNSAKVEVMLHMPCDPFEIDSKFEFIKTWVDERVDAISEEVMSAG